MIRYLFMHHFEKRKILQVLRQTSILLYLIILITNTPFPDTPHVRKLISHPPHIMKDDGTLSPSSFIPFRSFAGNWNVTGVSTNIFSVPVCNIFKEVIVDGQVCYQADIVWDSRILRMAEIPGQLQQEVLARKSID